MSKRLSAVIFALASVASAAQAAPTVKVTPGQLNIASDHAAIALTEKGGAAVSLEALGTQWLAPGLGGFEVHIVSQYTSKNSDYGRATYIPRILSQTPSQAELELTATGKQGEYGFCRLRKSLALRNDSAAVEWRCDFTVGSGAVVPQTQAFMFVQSAPADAELILPTQDRGIIKWRPGAGPVVSPVAQGWVAVRRAAKGIVYVMPFDDLQYIGARDAQDGIKLVWRTVPQRVDVEDTKVWRGVILPYQGLEQVHGASALGCGEILASQAQARVFAARAGDVRVSVDLRPQPDGTWRSVGQMTASLTAGLNTLSLPQALTEPGLYRVTLAGADHRLDLYAAVGDAAGVLPLQGERVEAAPAPISGRDIDYHDFAPTPHVPWAKPLAGGKLNIFATWGELADNRMVNEIMQRVDADVDTVTLATGLEIGWGLGGPLYGVRTRDDMIKGLMSCLGGRRDYDVIVVGDGINYDKTFGDEIGRLILDRVRNGAGLVFAGMAAVSPAFADALPVKRAFGFGDEDWTLKAAGYHPITAALPINDMASHITKYVGVKPDANLLITAGVDGVGDQATVNPLLVTSDYGKGRIVVLAGVPNGELGKAFLTRAILWAANRQPRLAVTELEAQREAYHYGDTPHVTLSCAGEPGQYELSIAVGDWTAQRPLRMRQAKTAVDLELPADLPVGVNRVDVRILRDGKVESFAAAHVRISPITDLRLTLQQTPNKDLGRPVYAWNTPIRGRVAGSASGYQLTVELEDGLGRVLDRVAPGADGSFTLSTRASQRYEASVVARLRSRGEVVQQVRTPVYVGLSDAEARWDEAQMLIYGSAHGARARVLKQAVDPWASSLGGDLRATCAIGVPCGIAHVDTGAWDSLVRKYAQTKDKQLLQRVPCINSPQYATMVEAIVHDRATPFATLRTIAYINGDEQSYTSYTREMDFCFSPWCLAEFRRYLKDRYGNLAALNRAWSTHYTSFDDVEPPLTEQVRTDATALAAWNDFRTFNNITFAKGYRMILDELHKVDAQARLGISGTQRPSVFGGHDYARLMPNFDMLQEYSFCDEMQLALNPRTRLAPAQGYSAGYSQGVSGAWRILALGGAGVSYYNETSGVYPTLRLAPGLRGGAEVIREARDSGISMALLAATKQYDDLSFYYSHESLNAGYIVFHNDNPYGKSIKWYRALAAGASVTPGWLTREQLLAGEAASRAIVMLNTYALGDEEIDALARFMDGGGWLIADENLGRTDLHLRERSDGGAVARLRKHPRFVKYESVEDVAAARRLLRERIGIVPHSEVVARESALDSTVNTFADGPILYTTVHNATAKTGRLSLAGAGDAWVYDARAGRLLGHGGEISFDVPAYEAVVLARLPYEVTALKVEAPGQVRRGGTLAIRVSVAASAAAQNHTFAFTAADPTGTSLLSDRWRVRGGHGAAETSFFVPFNAPTGRWTLNVRDAATGLTESVAFEVR